MKKSRKSKLDFIPNKLNKYSIRKFTVGTASILIGSLMFLGNSVEADAAVGDTTTPSTTSATPTTEAPTTATPTTEAPTTAAPTTEVPTTVAPTTEVPTAATSTTEAPTTEAPATTPEKATNVKFNADNSVLTGSATAGQTVELTLANGTVEKAVVDANGTFTFNNLNVGSGEIVKVVTVDGQLKSAPVEVTANIITPSTEAPTTETATTEAPTTEASTTEAPTTESATTEAATTEAPTTEAATTATPSTEAPTTTSVDTAAVTVDQTTAKLNTLTTVDEKKAALSDYLAQNTGTTQAEAVAQIDALNLDYANLTSDELMAALLQAIASKQDATTVVATPVATRNSLTNMKSITLDANAPINGLVATSSVQDSVQANAIYSPGDATKPQTYSGDSWIYRNGVFSDANQADAFPTSGVKVYLQWMNGKGFLSPVYYTITNPDGTFAFDLSKPVTDALGNTYTFKLAGDGNFAVRTWVENPDPANYNVIKHGDAMYGFHTRLNRKNESWDFTAGVNKIVNSQVVLQEVPNNKGYLLKPEADRTTSGTADGLFAETGIYGTVRGNVWYENGDGAGTLANQWIKDATDINATDVKVAASYVNDDIVKLFDQWKIDNPGYTLDTFKAAQANIIANYEAVNGVGSAIAETVVANVKADGSYYIPFKGLYGISPYVKGSTITDAQYGTIVADADVNHSSLMQWNGTLGQKHRHINEEYMYITPLVDNYAIWSDNFQTNMFENANDTLTTSLASDNISSVDFALLAPQPMHDVLVFDTAATFAKPGDVVQSTTAGLLPNQQYQVQWFRDGVAIGSPTTLTSAADGTLVSVPLTVPNDITAPTIFTSAVFLPGKSTTSLSSAFAADAFTAVVPTDEMTYTPDYIDTTVEPGTPVTIAAPTDVDGLTIPAGTTYAPADAATLPSWAVVNADGTITAS
ncbi:YSIRK-type signal peptide-containing protein, partial [Macrococcus capreoli]|uniref:YSIRK-type signal peptide-containing protein n=1 Tax=Macrococcus capreoli TaxID=2982690 RepID=UPI003EE6CB78